MYEVEIKVPADHDRVSQRLTAIDAIHVETVRQEDTYYDAPDRDFGETDEALRIRQERVQNGSVTGTESDTTTEAETRTLLTYKGPLLDSKSKTREEAETRVTDSNAIHSILDGLGYEPAATVKKKRDRYQIDGCTVTLDSVDGLGEFVEVEIETDGDERTTESVDNDETTAEADATVTSSTTIELARSRAEAVLDRLELDPAEQIRTSYLGLLLADES